MPNRIEHIGVVIDNLGEAKAFLGDVMGLNFVREVDLPHRGVSAAFYGYGDVQIEIIEPKTDEVRKQRLPAGKQAAIEHIAIVVDDLPQTLATMGARGVRWTPPDPPYVITPGRRWVMTDPETTDGITYQLIQLDA